MSAPIFTVANQLTLLRMALTPVLVLLIVSAQHVWALLVFVVAGVTDALDGLMARRVGQRTKLGAVLDPVADKLLLISCYAALTWSAGLGLRIPVWLTIITLSRDVMIVVSVAVVNFTLGQRIFFPSLWGKLCTVSQIATAGVVILLNCLDEAPGAVRYLFGITAGLTIASAVHYAYLGSARGAETS